MISPIAVPSTSAVTCTLLSGAVPYAGLAEADTERVLPAGAETLHVPDPPHSYPELHSFTLLHRVQLEGSEGVVAEHVVLSQPIIPLLLTPQTL